MLRGAYTVTSHSVFGSTRGRNSFSGVFGIHAEWLWNLSLQAFLLRGAYAVTSQVFLDPHGVGKAFQVFLDPREVDMSFYVFFDPRGVGMAF